MEIEFGGNKQVVEALCLPSINISLNIPGLRTVIDGFLKKGHDLADEMLLEATDQISDINLILGSKASYCIPEKEINFGKENQSVFSETRQGIILKGDVSRMLNDIPYLPFSQSPMQCLPVVVDHVIKPDHCMQSRKFCLVSNSSLKIIQDKDMDVLDSDGEVIEQQLMDAACEILESTCERVIQKDLSDYNDDTVEVNNQLIEFVLQKTDRNETGRLKMPILWNPRVSHLLGSYYALSKNILMSTLKKLKTKDHISLEQINKVFKEQEQMGIIQRIENLYQFF